MMSGELLTRSALWISFVAYAIGCIVFATTRPMKWVWLAWTICCAALVAHFIFAFHYYHEWSHESAYVDTARQTAALLAINCRGGLSINSAGYDGSDC